MPLNPRTLLGLLGKTSFLPARTRTQDNIHGGCPRPPLEVQPESGRRGEAVLRGAQGPRELRFSHT